MNLNFVWKYARTNDASNNNHCDLLYPVIPKLSCGADDSIKGIWLRLLTAVILLFTTLLMAASALLICGVALLALAVFSDGYALYPLSAPIPFELNGEEYLVIRSGPVKRQISVNYANNRHYYDALAKEEWEKFQKETAEAAARAASAAAAVAEQVKTF